METGNSITGARISGNIDGKLGDQFVSLHPK
jgi:hypothetical protein